MMSHSLITKQIKTYGELYLTNQSHIALAVSGGPDSMCLLHSIVGRWQAQGKDISHLHIMSCDHNTRENIEHEIDIVRQSSKGCSFQVFHYEGENKDEHTLRLRRHHQFVDYCQQHHITTIFTGHHLNDRIETTMLNMKRGTGINGVINMTVSEPHFLDNTITIIRPLINSSKKEILTYCHDQKIKYILDPTNDDITYSERNIMRKIINNNLSSDKFYQSWKILYNTLENTITNEHIIDLQQHIFHQQDYDLTTITTGQWTSEHLYNLYQYYHININPRSTTLHTLVQQLNQKSGNKITYQGLTIQAYQYASTIKKG